MIDLLEKQSSAKAKIRSTSAYITALYERLVLEGKGYLSEYMMPLDHALTLRYSFENPPRYPFPQIEFSFLSNEDLRFYYDSPRFQPYFAFLRARRERAWHETQKLYSARYGK